MNTLHLSLLAFGVVGCQSTPAPREVELAEPTLATAASAPFTAELLAAAREYRSWMRVSDHANIAPTDCRAPALAGVRVSESDDPRTHGRKLYFLFAKTPGAYLALPFSDWSDPAQRAKSERELVGEVLVKESWTAVPVDERSVPHLTTTSPSDRTHPAEYVRDGEQWLRTGEQRELFVMLKLDPLTPGTDRGWVYGTVTPDGARVTSSGRVASCMKCHVESEHDRLFGLKSDRARR